MIEWIIPAVIVGVGLIPKGKMTDERKLTVIFKNRKVGIVKGDSISYPKLIEKHKKEEYTTYLYSLPWVFLPKRSKPLSQ